LDVGDMVSLYVNEEFFSKKNNRYDFLRAGTKLNIVYEDSNILLLDKAPGLIVHPDRDGKVDCLINRVKKYLNGMGEYDPDCENSFAPSPVNRIDRNTGGFVAVAKNAESLKKLNEATKSKHIKKYYLCVVYGKMPKKEDVLEGFLKKDERLNKVQIYSNNPGNAKHILTRYRVLNEEEDTSLLEIDLLTGRTHQIRAHLSFAGSPILGDSKYGKNSINRTRGLKYQLLHAYKIVFDKNLDPEILDYLAGRTFVTQAPWFLKEFYHDITTTFYCKVSK
jgi:23S rRNA pseudouridine955/2504/2580 synthase